MRAQVRSSAVRARETTPGEERCGVMLCFVFVTKNDQRVVSVVRRTRQQSERQPYARWLVDGDPRGAGRFAESRGSHCVARAE